MSAENVFCYKTYGNSTPDNKPKVYFTCHPQDFDKYFDKVCDDIFSVSNCTIFYTLDMSASLDDENVLVNLERMSLFVIPITFRLLTKPNRSMDFDIRFAKEKHIPILPLMMETGIYEFYKAPDKFGELQCLRPYSTDPTEINYKDKLRKHLESVLIDDELASRVRKAFDAYIFLSYRKKDRKLANELIKMIHRNPECEDIAIWFDEFLTPGESFRQSIDRIMKDSCAFALLVTPHILEKRDDGTPNFVMGEEYPMAKAYGKPILPAEMEPTDQGLLTIEYPEIPQCIDPKSEEEFRCRLLDSLIGFAKSENNNDPEHNYLIGLAYLEGIDTEIDTEKGLKLITKAAEEGSTEAMDRLFHMYYMGISVTTDYDKAIYWAQKLYEYRLNTDGAENEHTRSALNNLALAHQKAGNIQEAFELNKKCADICISVLGENHPETLSSLNNLANSYSDVGETAKALMLHKTVYERRCDTLGEEHEDTVSSLINLALTYRENGDYQQCLELLEKAYDIIRRTMGENDSDTLTALLNLAVAYSDIGEYEHALELRKRGYELQLKQFGPEAPETLWGLNALAISYFEIGDYHLSLELLLECYELSCKVLGRDHPDTVHTLGALANAYCYSGNYQKALELYEECHNMNRLIFGDEHQNTISAAMNLANAYIATEDYQKALELLYDNYILCCDLFGEEHPVTLTFMHNLARTYHKTGDDQKSLELNSKCYELRCKILGESHPLTLTTLGNLANSYRYTGDDGKSLEMHLKSYNLHCQTLGDSHPNTLTSLTALAAAYVHTGDLNKALEMLEKCYELSCKVLGEDHPMTVDRLNLINLIRNELE